MKLTRFVVFLGLSLGATAPAPSQSGSYDVIVRGGHPAAVAAYLTAMLINPNNHALDGGPATAEMEKECVRELARLFGYDKLLGHLTSSGTIANLEALWVARELHPDKPIVHSSQAHYTHSRMSQVLRLRSIEVASTPRGGMDVAALRTVLEKESVGTVVVALGTTSLGAFDPRRS